MKSVLPVAIIVSSLISALVTLTVTALLSPQSIEADTMPTVVRAQAFVLEGAEGNTRAELGSDPDGSAGLTLFDQGGTPRAQIRVDLPGAPAALYLLDSDLTRRVAVTLNAQGDSLVLLRQPAAGGQGGAPLRLRLAVRADGTTTMGIFDSDGSACA